MISIIIPFYNEEQNLPILGKELVDNLKDLDYEIIFVDDGSIDSSKFKVESSKLKNTKIIHHRKRKGKGQALLDGFKASNGDVIIFMDGDLQDDPKDVRKFLKKIEEGFDFVNGWRKERKDNFSKTLPSSIFNFLLLKLLFRSKFHDINCGFKAMKRQVLQEVILYGDNYRFLPILAERTGFKTTEIVVNHKPRQYGQSKFGVFRLLFGSIDTLTTYFIYRFAEKPLHFFGSIGGILFTIGFVMAVYMSIERLFFGVFLYKRPLLFLAVLLIIVGIQIIMTGIIGEIIVYLNQKQKVHKV